MRVIIFFLLTHIAFATTNQKLNNEEVCRNIDAIECYNEGVKFMQGINREKNISKSVDYFQNACRGDVGMGCYALGLISYHGMRGEKNINNAIKYFEKSCELGVTDGCYNLGIYYDYRKNRWKAAPFFEKGCDLKDGKSCNKLGLYCDIGAYDSKYKVVKKIDERPKWHMLGEKIEFKSFQAMNYYNKACQYKHGSACFTIGIEYYLKMPKPKGKNVVLAKKIMNYFEKGCRYGDRDSCGQLGYEYLEGELVKKDLKKAKEYYISSCIKPEKISIACLQLKAYFQHIGK